MPRSSSHTHCLHPSTPLVCRLLLLAALATAALDLEAAVGGACVGVSAFSLAEADAEAYPVCCTTPAFDAPYPPCCIDAARIALRSLSGFDSFVAPTGNLTAEW